MVLRLTSMEQKALSFIDDKVEDTVRLAMELEVDEKKLLGILSNLEKAGLISIEFQKGKPFYARMSADGKKYVEKHRSDWKIC